MSIAGAIALIAIGAILRYAVNDEIESINLETVGIILMIAGVVGLLLTFVWHMMNRRRGDVVYERERPVERRVDPPPR
ncbi:MAG: hypothetical protein K0R88_2500 [Solirubrobacterales bacterium]|jgi:hypothetical protein|nr:hypothetical protein [Solirubrobacterales bacterium]